MAITSGSAAVNFTALDPTTFGLTPNVNVGVNQSFNIPFSNGSGANAFGLQYSAERTFTATTDVLDLANNSLTDPDGTTIDAARIKAVVVSNTGVDPITVGGGTDPVVNLPIFGLLPPGAWTACATPDATGWAVTASTAMNLTFTGTIGQTYEIILFVSNT